MALRQFDVFENPSDAARGYAPFLVVLSSHHLLSFDDLVVAPLITDARRTVPELEVPVTLGNQEFLLVVSELAGMAKRGSPQAVATLAAYEFEIRRALDRLFTGF